MWFENLGISIAPNQSKVATISIFSSDLFTLFIPPPPPSPPPHSNHMSCYLQTNVPNVLDTRTKTTTAKKNTHLSLIIPFFQPCSNKKTTTFQLPKSLPLFSLTSPFFFHYLNPLSSFYTPHTTMPSHLSPPAPSSSPPSYLSLTPNCHVYLSFFPLLTNSNALPPLLPTSLENHPHLFLSSFLRRTL